MLFDLLHWARPDGHATPKQKVAATDLAVDG